MSELEFKPISELNEDDGDVMVIRFYRDEGEIIGEPPIIDIMSISDMDFNIADWDLYAVIDWNPAFGMQWQIDQLKGDDDE